MRIKHLLIHNLASLKGTHEINFDTIAEQSSLFAITGETGSGKSTLLSAISLAIYGKNYKKTIVQNDLVTLGCAEGKAEVTYQIRNKTYQSVWFCRLKKKNGEDLKNPKPHRELFEITESGEKNLLQISEEEILGLNFDQFCKTVILNQGEFSRFLLASFSERKEILERFYNAEALSRIGKLAKQDLDDIQNEIKENKNKIEGILSHQTQDPKSLIKQVEEEEKTLVQKKSFQKDYETLSKNLEEIMGNLERKAMNEKRLLHIKATLSETTARHNELLIKFNVLKDEYFEKRALNEKEIPNLREAMGIDKELVFFHGQSEQEKKNIEKITLSNEKLSAEEKECIKELSKIDQVLQSEALKENLTISSLSSELENIRKLKSLRSDEGHLYQSQRRLTAIIQEYEEDGKKLANESQKINDFLSENKSIDLLEKQLLELSMLYEENVDFEKQRKNVELLCDKNKKQIQLIEEQERENKKNLTFLTGELNKKNKVIKLTQNSLELFELKKSIHHCLEASLKDGICVVCKTEITDKIFDSNEEDFKELDTLSKEKEALEEETILLKESIQKLELENSLHQKTILAIRENEKKEKEALFKIQQDLHVKDKNEIKKEEVKITELKNKIQNFLHEKTKLDMTLSGLREKYKKSKLEEEEIQERLNVCRGRIKDIQLSFTTLKENDFTDDNKILFYEKEMERVFKSLQKKSEISYKLENMQKRLAELALNLEESKEKKIKFENKIQQLQKERKRLTKVEQPSIKIDEMISSLKEKEKEYEAFQTNLKKVEIELKENEASKRQTSEQINDINIILELELKKLTEGLDEGKQNADKLLTELFRKLNINTFKDMPDPIILQATFKMLSHALEEIQQEIGVLQRNISKNQTLLEEYNKASQRKQLIELEIEKLQEILQRKELLFTLVGRDEFRNFVLSQIEKELIYQTNKELIKLCDGRYEIIQENKASRILPEFFIIDKLRDGGIRKVSTLSGGETFMVSLACALALAELSRGSAEIDSFFIDEGFGTLDEDSLEDVIEMLQSIQGLGKQIGVISHVKKLTERIPINIHLDKNRFGDSALSLLFN